MEIGICVIGVCGLTWPRWKAFVHTIEGAGFPGLYICDHFTAPVAPDYDSLEAWTALTWAAGATSRVEIGPLVSPFTFRDPVIMARVARDIDALSEGRFILGMGAGWMEREHSMFGYALPDDLSARAERLEEGVRLVHALLRDEERVTLSGKYYSVEDAVLLPRPWGPKSPRLLVGGNGEKRTLPLAARYADEWNSNGVPPERFRELNQRLDTLLDAIGRERTEVKRTAMANLLVDAEREAHFCSLLPDFDLEEGRRGGFLMGSREQILERVEEYESAGVERLILQVFDMEKVDHIEKSAEIVAPYLDQAKSS